MCKLDCYCHFQDCSFRQRKKAEKLNRTPSVIELTGRAKHIEEALDKGLLVVESRSSESSDIRDANLRFPCVNAPVSFVTSINI
jgi:hypothetical protein